MKLGLTLPSFVDDPDVPLGVAIAAESAGVDGVFVFDHVFRGDPRQRRPALEATALLGALAAETETITIGTLVSRATLRPPATLALGLETAHRIAGDRVVATIGAGDGQSREENESYGLAFGSLDDRLAALEQAVACSRGRGFPVWVGGSHPRVRAVAARSDGWNLWGGTPDAFATGASDVVERAPASVTLSWGGLVVLGRTDADVEAKRRRLQPGPHSIVGSPAAVADRLKPYADAGAEWIVLGPVDSSDARNGVVIGEELKPLMA